MASLNKKRAARLKRKKRIRKKLSGTAERPRLTVFRSSRHIYAQAIDDTCGHTIASASTLEREIEPDPKLQGKVSSAGMTGKILAERIMSKGIKEVVFDRNGFRYHGRIKAVSDSARQAGLKF